MELSDHLRWRSQAAKAAERERLGFIRQPAVRWLSPTLLIREGIQAGVSMAFGQFADKRELQGDEQPAFDYTGSGLFGGPEELWVDFLSDTGDGWDATYTMAWVLAQPELPGPERPLPQGEVLLLGGDEVYPSPAANAYEDRFIGPFSAAFPASADERHLFATPGNHDWYDGLGSFLRLFCRPGSLAAKTIGGWRMRQARSYYALRLPHRWWIWAIDIQLDTYIDNRQLEYFRELDLAEDDKVVLITAKPSWVKVKGRFEPASWRYLAFFERKLIRERGARLIATLTGDLHHYSRYEPEDAGHGPTRITAGGGGAYMSPTHTLPERIELPPAEDEPPLPYRRVEIYPRAEESRRLSWGVFALPLTTPSFAVMLAIVYGLLGAAIAGALGRGDDGIVAKAAEGGFPSFLGHGASAPSIALAAVLALLLVAYADFERKLARLLAGAVHAAVHVVAVAAIAYGIVQPFSASAAEVWVWLAVVGATALGGYFLGSLLFALDIFAIHRWRGYDAPRHTNEVFASQAIPDHKNLLRLHFDREGRLIVYPLGVRRVCHRWDPSPTDTGPRFVPREEEPEVAVIDEPIVLPPDER